MYRFFSILFLALCCCFFTITAEQSEVDHDDDIVLAYWIPDDVAATFDADDGKISEFWGVWDALEQKGLDAEHIDKLKLVPSRHEDCRGHSDDGFSGEDDAQIEFRFCWGTKGVYMLAKCWDDYWCDIGVDSVDNQMADWAYDYCDLIFDKFTRQEFMEIGPTEDEAVFGRPGRYAWTKTHCQFMYRFGGAEPAEEFVYYRYEEQTNSIFHYRFTFDEAEDMLGDFGVDLVIGDEAEIRTMEWFFPWNIITNGGTDFPRVADGDVDKVIGIELGYNDNDGEPLKTCHLRKHKGEGHWIRTFNIDQATGDTLDTILHYGGYLDLEFAHGLPPTNPEPVINPLTQSIHTTQAIEKVEYFDLNGIDPKPSDASFTIPRNSIVIQKIRYTDGTVVTRNVMTKKGTKIH
jgi:hypothetical protein